MEQTPQIELAQFQEALTPQRIRTFQIIAAVLWIGATVFLGVVLISYSASVPDQTQTNSILPVLTIVHAVEASFSYLAAFFIYRFCTSPGGLAFLQKQNAVQGDLQVPFVGAIFTGYILSAALLEGTALFGLVVCMVGTMDGTILQSPVYWLNLFSYVVFSAFILKTFPTKPRLENIFLRRFQVDRMA